ncbi:GRIP and coiled-coil domain-containing protein 2 isoform X2 [Abrus precatorius]|uniref:GRIP and coiled-coil domain-containing protein 2 isoform X2 n=1 Tax=Abrus precatorius TaxID=3816 RepID=A0A8B8JSV1_ABRPR|nr:GRIP and coiled-coil domain-containing protein 2 isoform X2 [Abrus precatorius]
MEVSLESHYIQVTVQLLTSKTGFREFEQQRELRERGLQTSDQGTHDESADSKESSPDQNVNNHINKVTSRVKLKRESKELPRISSLEGNEEYADSAAGFDGSSTTSGSIYNEKHDISSTHEVDSLKSTVSGDLVGLSLSQSPQPEKGEATDNQFPSRGSDWVHGWGVDYSAANNLAAASEDSSSSKLKGNLEAVESSILDLKLKVSSLQNHADEIGVETHKFSEQLAVEISSGEELAKEVAILKSECSMFKDEFEQLKSSKLSLAFALKEPIDTDQDFQNFQHKWIKGLLLMEDKLRDVQKLSMGFPERDFRFLNLELEALAEILQNLKQESGEPISGTKAVNARDNKKMDLHKGEQLLTDIGMDAGLFQSESMTHYLTIPGLTSHEFDSVDPTLAMKEKVFELLRELDESKTERESLVRKMDQMECYYEALIQELEQSQRQMMAELQNLRNEHSTCLYTISAGKTEMERLHQNMNEQMMKFSEDKRILESLNNEFERRAISAEASLKRARLNYSIAVGQLQKDLELLSCQVLSMHETNENLIKQTFSDSSLPNTDGCQEPAKYPKSSEGHTSNRLLCQNHSSSLHRQHLGEDILLSDLKRSLQLQEGLYRQVEEEICQMHFVNIYSDVFSKALQETLLEASLDIQLMKEKIVQLSQQLELTNESNELLVLRLQNAMNDVVSLNEYKEICTAKNNDISHQNQILEANLKDLAHENNLLTEKINELEVLLTECRSFEGKYMECNAENSELKSLLKKETLENDDLHDQISVLQEELKAIRTKFDELASTKDNLQNNVIFSSNKLQKLLASYEQRHNRLSLCNRSASLDSECKDLEGLLLQLEELQQSAFDRILQLTEEKKILVHEKHMAQISLNTAESDVVVMKQKFEHDLQEMLRNINVLGALLQKLQLDFEVIINRINTGFEAEELHSQHHTEFLSGLDHLEAELQQINSRNQELAQEIIKLGTSSSDLEMCKLALATITEEKKALELSLQEKIEESANISSELNFLKTNLHSLHNDLHAEKIVREKLEKTVTDLTTELNEKQCQLQDSDMNRQELVHLRQMVTDLEFEKSRISNLLQKSEKHLKDTLEEFSSISYLETQLSEMHESSIASDVVITFSRAQFEDHMEELTEKLHSTCSQLDDLTMELNEKQCQLQDSDMNRQELVHLKQMVKDLEFEKSRISDLLQKSEKHLKDSLKESSSISCLENQLSEMHEFSTATDVVMTFTRAQFEDHMEELSEKLHTTCRQLDALHKKNLEVESELNDCLCRELTCIEENTTWLTSIDFLKSELAVLTAQSGALIDQNSALMSELKEHKSRKEVSNTAYACESQCVLEVAKLEQLLVSCSRDGEELFLSKEEAELKCIVIQAKLEELETAVTSLKQSDNELIRLQNQCNELTKRLSEQVLKTEEFKNLSIHLKELKDKAEAECLNARDKRGHEGPPVAMQESLRIAFIKEQYETKLQELKQQLSLSKKHSEEMLWKLQDAIDETENRKKSEASHIKINEELGMKILELEAELQAVLSDKRNLLNAYDLVKAEKECSAITLECCKQEKQELEASLVKCNEEKSKIEVELTSAKELIETLRSHANALSEGNDTSSSLNPQEKSTHAACSHDPESANSLINVKPEDPLAFRVMNGCQTLGTDEDLQHEVKKHVASTESLKSSIDHLNEELERMKKENMLPSADGHSHEPSFPGVQRELIQLHEANQELGNIFPVFDKISVSGNALERVLALEIELAEALRAKKKTSIQFQSSFVKHHSDEEAVFRSFRDINELIKDMLELKARHSAIETELKEMHDRYSQLSLQFAEVEGERQKLMMTLKNTRASKKASNSSAYFGDHSL